MAAAAGRGRDDRATGSVAWRCPRRCGAILSPLRTWLAELNRLIAAADAAVATEAKRDPIAAQLMTAPGVGPVVALTFQAVLDDPARFGGDAARASAFLGLVPSEDSSAERRLKGHITKAGPADLRALLVQASWVIWRGRSAGRRRVAHVGARVGGAARAAHRDRGAGAAPQSGPVCDVA